jgi:hypothetical protein
MHKRCLLLFVLIYTSAFSQNTALDFSNSISQDSIREYLYTLTADSMEGRETGKRGQRIAAEFIKSKYSSWGLRPMGDSIVNGSVGEKGYFQNHSITPRANKGKNLVVKGKEFLFGRDFYYSDSKTDTLLNFNEFIFIGSDSRKAMVSDKMAWPVILRSEKYKNKNLVLFDADSASIPADLFNPDQTSYPSSVFIVTTKQALRSQLHLTKLRADNNNTHIFLITEDVADTLFKAGQYNKLKKSFLKKSKVKSGKFSCPVSIKRIAVTEGMRGQNVVAFIPGTDRQNETVVVSAHYDHLGIRDSLIHPGADDDASGTSAVIEMARIFTKAQNQGRGPRRNILFLNVSGEEKGLLGSAWFVSNPTIPLQSIVADLNIDMIGRTDSIHDSTGVKNYVYVIGADKLSSELQQINENQNSLGPKLELDYKYNSPDDPNRFYRRSDHYNFAKNNIPIIFYFDGKHADYHKPSDTPDKINYELLTQRARLVFLTAWELANRNVRLVIDKKNDLLK